MIVVADSSPIIVLIGIGHIDVLPGLFGQVVIPPEVLAELHQFNRPQSVHDFIAARPPPGLLSECLAQSRRFPRSMRVNSPLSAWHKS